MKTSDKIMSILVVIVAFIIGWYAYQYFTAEPAVDEVPGLVIAEQTAIDEQKVEFPSTVEGWQLPSFRDDMNCRKGVYFLGDYLGETLTNQGVSKEKFEEVTQYFSEKLIKRTAKQLKRFFNLKYTEIKPLKDDGSKFYVSSMFDPRWKYGLHNCGFFVGHKFDQVLGNADQFFIDHKLNLRCDSLSINKISYCNLNLNEECCNYFYYITGEAKVNAEGVHHYEKTATFLPRNCKTETIQFACTIEDHKETGEIVFHELYLESPHGNFIALC